MNESQAVLLIVCLSVFGLFGGWIATQKRRRLLEGFLLGLLFGPLGCLIEAVLPTAGLVRRRRRDADDDDDEDGSETRIAHRGESVAQRGQRIRNERRRIRDAG